MNKLVLALGLVSLALGLGMVARTNALAGLNLGAYPATACATSPGGGGYCRGTDAGFRNHPDAGLYMTLVHNGTSRNAYVNSPATGFRYLSLPATASQSLREAFDAALVARPEAIRFIGFNGNDQITSIQIFRAPYYVE